MVACEIAPLVNECGFSRRKRDMNGIVQPYIGKDPSCSWRKRRYVRYIQVVPPKEPEKPEEKPPCK